MASPDEVSDKQTCRRLNGWIVRAEDSGLGVLVDEEENEYPFKLGAIEGYRGQAIKSLGLKNVPRFVDFVVHDGGVVSISLTPRTKETKTLSLDYRMLWQNGGKLARVR